MAYSIVIVNYKTPELLLNCVKSIKKESRVSHEIIIVDNASNDNSQQLLTSYFKDIIWVQNDSNYGFGIANNIGIENTNFPNVILLNSDTIVINRSLDLLHAKFSAEENNIGLAGCQLLYQDGSKQTSYFVDFASYKQILNQNLIFNKLFKIITSKAKEENIAALHGACLIFNKNRLQNVGFFDEDFFLYSEEIEWCHRVKKNNFNLKFYENISILHVEAGSENSSAWTQRQRLISNALLFKKVKGNIGVLIMIMLTFINLLMNSLLLWKMEKNYIIDFKKHHRSFWSVSMYYIKIILNTFSKPLKLRT